MPTGTTRRPGQQPLPLVVPQRLHVDPGQPGHFAGTQSPLRHHRPVSREPTRKHAARRPRPPGAVTCPLHHHQWDGAREGGPGPRQTCSITGNEEGWPGATPHARPVTSSLLGGRRESRSRQRGSPRASGRAPSFHQYRWSGGREGGPGPRPDPLDHLERASPTRCHALIRSRRHCSEVGGKAAPGGAGRLVRPGARRLFRSTGGAAGGRGSRPTPRSARSSGTRRASPARRHALIRSRRHCSEVGGKVAPGDAGSPRASGGAAGGEGGP
jgi:hypothetical protein